MLEDYLFEIGKIVDGAANGDFEKVVAYGEQLEKKLEKAGKHSAAKRIRQIVGKSKAAKVTAARTNSSHQLPLDNESQTTLADEERIAPGDVKLFLPETTAETVKRFLVFLRAADRLMANGVGVAPSMLIYGPSGCGKTLLARYIASELGYPLLVARSDGLISSYLGSTAKNLRSLFEHAVSRPCVFFLDEFDALAKMRDDEHELGELKRVVISLLQNIDAMGRDHVLLAATNHEHLLDPAIWRRFSYKIKIDLPDFHARQEMARLFLGNFSSDSVAETLAALGDGLSGAQLRDIAEDSVREAVVNRESDVNVSVLASRTWDVVHPDMPDATLQERVRAVKRLDPRRFTQKRLADIFSISPSHVWNLLNKGPSNAA